MMLQRSSRSSFFANAYVFPGGRLDKVNLHHLLTFLFLVSEVYSPLMHLMSEKLLSQFDINFVHFRVVFSELNQV